MKNQYQILKDRQHKEFNAFPLGAAFSQTQFTEMMAKWGLEPTDTDKILHVGAGCYIRKTDREAFHALVERLEKEKQDAIAADTTGEGSTCTVVSGSKIRALSIFCTPNR